MANSVKFNNLPKTVDDLFTGTGLTEVSLGTVTLSVMANDGASGATLYSLDGGNKSTDLLTQDTARTEAASTDLSDTFGTALSLTSTTTSTVAAVVQYLENQDFGNAGSTVAFTASINGAAHTYVFTQGDDAGTNNLDVLVDLGGVTAIGVTTGVATTGQVHVGWAGTRLRGSALAAVPFSRPATVPGVLACGCWRGHQRERESAGRRGPHHSSIRPIHDLVHTASQRCAVRHAFRADKARAGAAQRLSSGSAPAATACAPHTQPPSGNPT